MEYMLSTARKREFVSEFRSRLESADDIPVLPEVARQLILLRSQPDASIAELTDVISSDPAISLQLVRYARMSGFGYGERIKTIAEAVQLVLGFNKSLHMAMGFSAGNSLNMPNDGPIGRDHYWEHAMQSAILSQFLARELPMDKKLDLGVCYLAGLVHDIGFMLLGHWYPEEFSMLSHLIERCNNRDLRELEFQCLGISHDMVGLCLLRAWDMPEEVTAAAGEHHFPDYGGKHANYAKLVYLANYLLNEENNSTGGLLDYSQALLDTSELGLEKEGVERALQSLHEMSSEVEQLATGMVA